MNYKLLQAQYAIKNNYLVTISNEKYYITYLSCIYLFLIFKEIN